MTMACFGLANKAHAGTPLDVTMEAGALLSLCQAPPRAIAGGERYELRTKTFVYVNNRLEGNSLETIGAMVARTVALLDQSRRDAVSKS